MPDKPRVKAPRQRTAPGPDDAVRRWRMLVLAAGALAAAILLGAGFFLLGAATGEASEEDARASLEAAGCTFRVADALPGVHSIRDPGDESDEWNTDPPTTGPHYPIAAIFGIYEEPVELARLVHNLEHGGVYILYGDEVPEATVEELRDFYDGNKTGTIMAPLPRLGDEFALGAWVAEGEWGNGYLARCTTFEEGAVSDFFEAFQFRGPERFDPADLRPGH